MHASDRPAPPDPTSPPWPQYAEAVVEIVIGGAHGVHLVLTPDDAVLDDAGPGALVRVLAQMSGDVTPPLWVLTAGDPYPETLTAEENAARNARLRDELEALGIRHAPALGRADDGSTSERSTAVHGAGTDRATVLAIAARHGQLAVYEIDDRIRCVDVASAGVVTVRTFRLQHAPAGSGSLVGPTGWEG